MKETGKPQFTRVAAYGLIHDDDAMLLCRLSPEVPRFGGQWTLPGGGIEFGEHPVDAVIREVAEETGLTVEPGELVTVDSIAGEVPHTYFHSLRIIYRATVLGGEMRNEVDGTTDLCQWHPRGSIEKLPLVDLVRLALPHVFEN